MGHTKANPSLFSCLDRRLVGEPYFVLMARDPEFGPVVHAWARLRDAAIKAGDRPAADLAQVIEAHECAAEGVAWRAANLYAWRGRVELSADCYDRLMPDEPYFELLARDPAFALLVHGWANVRESAIRSGDRPHEDGGLVADARALAEQGAVWRAANLYAWRAEQPRTGLDDGPLLAAAR
jgi:hypothetical protein